MRCVQNIIGCCIHTRCCTHRVQGQKYALTLSLLTWRIWWAPNNASRWQMGFNSAFNPLKAKLNPICHLLALLGVHHIIHFSTIRVKGLNVFAAFQRLRNALLWVITQRVVVMSYGRFGTLYRSYPRDFRESWILNEFLNPEVGTRGGVPKRR